MTFKDPWMILENLVVGIRAAPLWTRLKKAPKLDEGFGSRVGQRARPDLRDCDFATHVRVDGTKISIGAGGIDLY